MKVFEPAGRVILEDETDYRGRKFPVSSFFAMKDSGRGPGWFIWGRSEEGVIRKMGWPDRPKRKFRYYNSPVHAGWGSKYEADRAISIIQQKYGVSENPRKRKRCWPGYRPVPGKKAYSKGSCVRKNPFRVGGHPRETPEEAGYRVVSLKGRTLILQDKADGKLEEWAKSNGFAGYAIRYKNNDYEFVTSNVRQNPTGSTWTIWEYDVWGNAEDGYDVNNRMRSGKITLTEGELNDKFLFDAAMKRNGMNVRWKDIDQNAGDQEDAIYFVRESDGMPLGEITRD